MKWIVKIPWISFSGKEFSEVFIQIVTEKMNVLNFSHFEIFFEVAYIFMKF